MAGLYGNGVELTEKMMDFLWERQSVGLNNVANVDTPGYKTRYITLDMDQEQVDLVRTAYEYQFMLNSVNNDLKRLQSAAKAF